MLIPIARDYSRHPKSPRTPSPPDSLRPRRYRSSADSTARRRRLRRRRPLSQDPLSICTRPRPTHSQLERGGKERYLCVSLGRHLGPKAGWGHYSIRISGGQREPHDAVAIRKEEPSNEAVLGAFNFLGHCGSAGASAVEVSIVAPLLRPRVRGHRLQVRVEPQDRSSLAVSGPIPVQARHHESVTYSSQTQDLLRIVTFRPRLDTSNGVAVELVN